MRSGWRGRGPLVAACAAAVLAALPTVLAAAGVRAKWALTAGTVVAAVAGLLLAVLTNDVTGARQRRRQEEQDGEQIARSCLGADGTRLPLVGEITDPGRLGVRRAWGAEGPDALMPPYVRREEHGALVRDIRAGAFVLLVGTELAGTSRTAYEAMREAVPGHVLIAPDPALPERLEAVLDRAEREPECVLWLDGARRFLGPGGLTRERVEALRRGGRRPIVATMRTGDHTACLSGGSPEDRDGRQALDSVRRHTLERHLPERGAWALLDGEENVDPRVAEARRAADTFGLAEYLTAGPLQHERWRNGWEKGANPCGAALVRAAVDCRRMGLERRLPRALLERMRHGYLDGHEPRLRTEPLAEAWAWAHEQTEGLVSLLYPDEGPVEVFPYLVERARERDRRGRPTPDWVPDHACLAVLEDASPEEAETLGGLAFHYQRDAVVRRALERSLSVRTVRDGPRAGGTLAVRSALARDFHRREETAEAGRLVRGWTRDMAEVLGSAIPRPWPAAMCWRSRCTRRARGRRASPSAPQPMPGSPSCGAPRTPRSGTAPTYWRPCGAVLPRRSMRGRRAALIPGPRAASWSPGERNWARGPPPP